MGTVEIVGGGGGGGELDFVSKPKTQKVILEKMG